ncbi:sulfite exporter TauE/SafE family protein [Bowmanella pacifica]|uniref:Probable membrane transporter protein n=1 Tax=Bowmanella pacifica TaxID=502051 RepID=A0A917YU89_9ALTE|nr:sulfite exporter TauE/SafE family protein [Bowmanella pacifica]GGO64430.1 UPF0721 transmembrane protein [Bowmanella pacifica]
MEWIVVLLAGFFGGLLNAVAGGGSFLTLPALIFAGLPAVSANATGTAALLPGYIASAWRFRRDIQLPANMGLLTLSLLAIVGGSIGAAILLVSSEQLFAQLIPWLILFATLAFILGPRLLQRNASQARHSATPSSASKKQQLGNIAVLLAVCIYGGYFNGGLGIILLATLGLMGQSNLHGMNGVKNLVSALLTTVAVAVYAIGNAISLQYLLVLGVAAMAGGYVGAAFAYRIPTLYLRYFIVAVGIGMTAIFFFRLS